MHAPPTDAHSLRVPGLAGAVPELTKVHAQVSVHTSNTEATLRRVRRHAAMERETALRTLDSVMLSLPAMVDELIMGKQGGQVLQQRYENLLKSSGAYEAAQCFRTSVEREFQDALEEQVTAAADDVELLPDLGLVATACDRLREEHERKARFGRAGRAAVRVGGQVAVGLGALAAFNFWNPAGWAIAAFAAAGLLASRGADYALKRVTESWRQSDERELAMHRDAILEELTRETQGAQKHLRQSIDRWEDSLFSSARRDLLGSLQFAERLVEDALDGARTGVAELSALTVRIEEDLGAVTK